MLSLENGTKLREMEFRGCIHMIQQEISLSSISNMDETKCQLFQKAINQ